MANTTHKASIRFQAQGNVAEHAKKVAESLNEVNKTLNKMGKEAKEATGIASKGVEEFQNSIGNFAKSLVTIEAVKAGFEAVSKYVNESIKKFQEAEVKAGRSLEFISKNTVKLQKDMDKLQVSVGGLFNALKEQALEQDDKKEKSMPAVLTSLVDKSAKFSDKIYDVGKALAVMNPLLQPVILSYTLLGGALSEAARALDEFTDSEKKFTPKLNIGLNDRVRGMTLDTRRKVTDLPPLQPPKTKPKGTKKRAQTDAEFLGSLPGFGSTAEADALAREFEQADAAKAKAEADAKAAAAAQEKLQQEYDLRQKIASLRMEDRELEAQLEEINANKDLTPMERELEIMRAKNEEATREGEILIANAERKMAYVDAAQTGADAIAGALGIEAELKIAQAAIDGAQAAYMSLMHFGTGDFVGGATLAAASVQAFALAGQSASKAGGGGSAKRKPAATATARPGATARETAAGVSTDSPRTSVYNVTFRSLSTPTPREARQIAQALGRESRSNV
jgi:hypothetical protein